MTPTQVKLAALAQKHPPLSEDEPARAISRLSQMLLFYDKKSIKAPEGQVLMFKGFIDSLTFAIDIINDYRKMTRELAELTQEDKQ